MNQKIVEEKYNKIYQNFIKPEISKLEIYRIEQKKKHDIFYIITFVSAAFIPILVLVSILTENSFIGFASFIILVAFFVTFFVSLFVLIPRANKIKNKFRKDIKSKLLTQILSALGDLKLENNEIISLKNIHNMGLYKISTRKTDDDKIVGIYNDIPISIVETVLSHQGSKSLVIDFNGLILKIKMNKKFEGVTVARQKITIENIKKIFEEFDKKYSSFIKTERNAYINNSLANILFHSQNIINKDLLNIIGKGICVKSDLTGTNNELEQIELEDPEFNKNYKVYSDNQIEARYLLTPSFMERIKNMQTVFLALSVDFVFKEDFLYVFLNGGVSSQTVENGFFEVTDINKSLLNKDNYLKIFVEFVEILSLIDYFKLNRKIGL